MVKRIILLSVFVVCLLSFVPVAHAQPHMPANYNCTSVCIARTYWDSASANVYGAYTYLQGGISNPGLHSTPGVWDRFVVVDNGPAQSNPGCANCGSVVAGFEKNTSGAGGYCTGGGGLYFFGAFYDIYGNDLSNQCMAVPSADINLDVAIKIGPYTSNGGGMLVEFKQQNGADYLCNNGTQNCAFGESYASGEPRNFWEMMMREQILDNVQGHEVWGVGWIHNQWENSSNVWSYQGRDPNFTAANNPPQLYWSTPPRNTNAGGVMLTCVYDAGTQCSLGS